MTIYRLDILLFLFGTSLLFHVLCHFLYFIIGSDNFLKTGLCFWGLLEFGSLYIEWSRSRKWRSHILAWKIPRIESLVGYSPWGHRVGHDSVTEDAALSSYPDWEQDGIAGTLLPGTQSPGLMPQMTFCLWLISESLSRVSRGGSCQGLTPSSWRQLEYRRNP